MTTKLDTNDEESFIILGSSPGNSMDLRYNGISISDSPLCKMDIADAMKDLSVEANMAFKAHFKLGDCPSPASMMVASTLVSDDKTTEDLQKKFGEILDENVILKETLKQNNDSMKEQFMLIASCQEDMLQTHRMHKEKFDETRGLIEKLRQENKKLKSDITRLAEGSQPSSDRSLAIDPTDRIDSLTKSTHQSLNKSAQQSLNISAHQSLNKTEAPSNTPSTIEFVTSPDDDMFNKLTAQLELVEKQRRQVIMENEKLTWQKESLENIVDATSKERDDVKEILRIIELQHSSKEEKYITEINKLKFVIDDLQRKVQMTSAAKHVPTDELHKRDATIQQMDAKISSLQTDLKNAQLKVLELESVKMEYARQKAGTAEIMKTYKEQIQDLHGRLKQAQTTVFQPVRFSMSVDSDASQSEYSSFVTNIKLYDRTLKHLSELLNNITHCTSGCLVDTMGLVTSLHEYKLDRTSADSLKSGLNEVKKVLEQQHTSSLNHIGQIRGTLSILEGIFQDYKEILKKGLTKNEQPQTTNTANVEALTTALVARGKELQTTKEELKALQSEVVALRLARDDVNLLKAQIDIYKNDFEEERKSREKIASDKESVTSELRAAQKTNKELADQLEEVRKVNPGVYQQVTKKKAPLTRTPPAPSPARGAATTGNMVYKCPKCISFSSDQYSVMEDHFDFCLDDLF